MKRLRIVLQLVVLVLWRLVIGYSLDYKYDLVEAGTMRNASKFLKYKAVVVANATHRADMTVKEWAQETIQNGDANRHLMTVLVPYDAYYFETPAVRRETMSSQTFEFVLVDADPSLAKRNPSFRSYEKPCRMANVTNNMGCVFSNLSGDAMLVVPKPAVQHERCYTHLADFMRFSSYEQIDSLWKMVAEAYITALGEGNDVWLSTAGHGVPWLHFRLDSTPKYYCYNPYKQMGGTLRQTKVAEL